MENKARVKIMLILAALIIIANLLFLALFFIGTAKADYYHSWTKAICSENTCRDYEIYCNNESIVKMTPITGFVTMPANWEDPRSEKDASKLCG